MAPSESKKGPGSPFVVVSGGRLVHWKGFDILIEGFAAFVNSADENARLVFTGEGKFRRHLEELAARCGIAENVDFVGQLPSLDDVYALLANADIYALPTARDGPPTAILEAMLAAKPILCLDLGATSELVPDFAGLKVPLRKSVTAGKWSAASRRRLLGHATIPPTPPDGQPCAGARVLEVHHWRRIGDEVDALYASVSKSETDAVASGPSART